MQTLRRHPDRRQFETAAPGLLTAHIPGVLHAEFTAEGMLARAAGDEMGLVTVPRPAS